MTQKQVVAWLASLPKQKKSLVTIQTLLQTLGNPQNQLQFVHVAGTNGKGSVCAMVANILAESGYKTGRFVSPYILEFRERMAIDGKMIPEAELSLVAEAVKQAVEQANEAGIFPTEFDAVTAMGLLYFAKSHCDLVVLEVGLGGRLDSTNCIASENTLLSIITTIALDHTEFLGDTLTAIAKEKGGILKENGTLLLGDSIPEEARHVLLAQAKEQHNTVYTASTQKVVPVTRSPQGQTFLYHEELLTLPMAGVYQQENLAIALQTVALLREKGFAISKTAIKQGLAKTSFPARMELVAEHPLVFLDGAHNEAGARALAETVEALSLPHPRICLCGMMQDKAWQKMLAVLSPHFDAVVTTEVDMARALPKEALASAWQKLGTKAMPVDLSQAFTFAKKLAGKHGSVVCCGSLYLCSTVRNNLI